MTFQVVAMLGFMLLIGWLINNTAQNLLDLGKEPSFKFLGEPAGYDINQRLIDYDNQNSHMRAAFIGLLNTLLVAVMGCITATILGVIIGVLRLSKNWLIAKLMTVYVETFRNVPVLLWIVFTMAVLIETLPSPRAFRGVETGSIVVTNRGIYVPEPLFSRSLGDIHLFGASSFRFNVSLDLIVVLIALGLGLFVRHKIKLRANRIQEATGNRPTTWYLSLGAVVVPLAMVLIGLGFHLGYPALTGFNFQGGTHMRNSLIALWLALSLYTAAFIAENVRAGILAISKGQTEVAAALGFRSSRIMGLVVLPQAHAGDHPASAFAVSQPDQKLVSGHRRWLYGPDRHIDGHRPEPNRPRTGNGSAGHADLSGDQPEHLDGDELV